MQDRIMEDRKMQKQIWGKVRRWKMEDQLMSCQSFPNIRRWKILEHTMQDGVLERKIQDQIQ